jgi:hypothetical protein
MKRRQFLLSSAGAIGAAVCSVARAAPAPCPPPALAVRGKASVQSNCIVGAGAFEPAIDREPQEEQFLMVDDDDTSLGGANYKYWNRRLQVPWVHETSGDFLDADGVEQGDKPFSSMRLNTVSAYNDGDVTALVKKAVASGINRGVYLRVSGASAPSVRIAGRLAMAPKLRVVTSNGTFTPEVQFTANWFAAHRQELPRNSTDHVDLSSTSFGIIRFDLSRVTGTIHSATVSLYLIQRSASDSGIDFFEANPPRFIVGAGELAPIAGLAAEVGESNLAAHPDVLLAGHFLGTTVGPPTSNSRSTKSPAMQGADIRYQHAVQIVDDPDAPGTAYWRGECINVRPGSANRDPLQIWKKVMFADRRDPKFPVDTATLLEEAYFRMYVMLEDDWLDRTEGAKFGVCWDLRLGIWDDVAGWWSTQGGNSNHISDGMRHLGDCHAIGNTSLGGSDYYSHPSYAQYCYKGHMQRQEPTRSGRAGQPYSDLYSLLGYNYNNDLYDPDSPSSHDSFGPDGGAWFPTGNIVQSKLRKGRWYCIEQHLKMNSIDLSRPDSLGNGIARADGLLETWVNGVLVDRVDGMKWRCHPHMGIGRAGSVWYIGGNGTTNWEGPMHFRVSHLAFAKRYIGPRVKPKA